KYLLLGILLIICIGGVFVFLILNRPGKSLTNTEKNQALQQLLGRKPVFEEKKVSNEMLIHKSNYIQFSYPQRAIINEIENKQLLQNPILLDGFVFSLNDPHL